MRTLLALTLFAAACSPYTIGGATTPTMAAFGTSRTDVGTICVIRSSAFAQAVTFIVHDNQTLVGATRGQSHFCYEAAPGEHEIVSQTFDSFDHPGRTQVVIAPGQRYWLEQDHENNLGSVISILTWLHVDHARALIDGTEYRVLTEVPGHERVPAAIPFAPARPAVAMR